MKYSNLNALTAVLALTVSLSSCSFIEGVFKTGMGVGIFLVVFVIVLIIAALARIGRK